MLRAPPFRRSARESPKVSNDGHKVLARRLLAGIFQADRVGCQRAANAANLTTAGQMLDGARSTASGQHHNLPPLDNDERSRKMLTSTL